MIRKIRHIVIGWGKRLGFLPTSKAEVELAALRMKQCGKCAYSKESKVLRILNGRAEYEHQLGCMKCGCPCYEKTIVVDERCPIDKW